MATIPEYHEFPADLTLQHVVFVHRHGIDNL
jgi:hypothetical protein